MAGTCEGLCKASQKDHMHGTANEHRWREVVSTIQNLPQAFVKVCLSEPTVSVARSALCPVDKINVADYQVKLTLQKQISFYRRGMSERQ